MESDIVIVSEDKNSLEACITLLNRYTDEHEIIVIARSSSPSITCPGTVVLPLENTGYAAACNLGAAAGINGVICFVSSNIRVSEGWLPALVGPFADKKIVVTGLILVNPVGRTNIDAVCHGACIAVRRSWFESVGGFRTLPFGGEDTEIRLRAKADDRAAILVQKAVVFDREYNLAAGHPLPTFYLSEGRQMVEKLFTQPELVFAGTTKTIVVGVPMRDLSAADLYKLERCGITRTDILKLRGPKGQLFKNVPKRKEKHEPVFGTLEKSVVGYEQKKT